MPDNSQEPKLEVEDVFLNSSGLSADIIQRSRWLRNNTTSFEKKIYKILGGKDDTTGWGFLRQWPIEGYYVDFFSMKYNLVVEVDGPNHILRRKSDAERDEILLKKKGIRVARISWGDFKRYGGAWLFDWLKSYIEWGVSDPKPNEVKS